MLQRAVPGKVRSHRQYCRYGSACLAGLLLLGALGAAAGEADWARDPIEVFYPKRHCLGTELELQAWDREARAWGRHPGHPRIPVESCQLEDAGRLLNEVRWRCIEPGSGEFAPWIVGLEVFDPAVMDVCARPARALEVHVVSPAPGSQLRSAELEIAIEGAVREDGASLSDVTGVVVANRTAGGEPRPARVGADGRFEATLVAANGTNQLWARATLADGGTVERVWDFEFDDSLARLLAGERDHIRRAREKRVQLREARSDEIAAPSVDVPRE